jgi:hypothetical protein
MTIRPRRSLLYMPGSNARALEKAKTLPADGVILDLEDSVAPEAKKAARQQVADTVKAGGFGAREVFVRVNGVDTPWHADDLSAEGVERGHTGDDRPPPARYGYRSQDASVGNDRNPACDLQHSADRRSRT